jgi:2-phospho-L-lactate guanylyltransferase
MNESASMMPFDLNPEVDSCSDAHHKSIWALVPVKRLYLAKQRLADHLGDKREGLFLAMLQDVLEALSRSAEIDRVAVVTNDPGVKAAVREMGHLVIDEQGPNELNSAIQSGFDAIKSQGVKRVIIFPADIPLLTGSEVDRLIQLFNEKQRFQKHSAVGINASNDGDGTNCLILDTDLNFKFSYGKNSFDLHRQSAKSNDCDLISLSSPAISLDIDEPSDLRLLLAYGFENPIFQQSNTWKYLLNTGLTVQDKPIEQGEI